MDRRERIARGIETAGLVLAVVWVGGWLNDKIESLLAGAPVPRIWLLPAPLVWLLGLGAARLVRRGRAG